MLPIIDSYQFTDLKFIITTLRCGHNICHTHLEPGAAVAGMTGVVAISKRRDDGLEVFKLL